MVVKCGFGCRLEGIVAYKGLLPGIMTTIVYVHIYLWSIPQREDLYIPYIVKNDTPNHFQNACTAELSDLVQLG